MAGFTSPYGEPTFLYLYTAGAAMQNNKQYKRVPFKGEIIDQQLKTAQVTVFSSSAFVFSLLRTFFLQFDTHHYTIRF